MEDTLPCLFTASMQRYSRPILSCITHLTESRVEAAKAFSKAALAGILTRNYILTPRRSDHSKMGGTDGKLSIRYWWRSRRSISGCQIHDPFERRGAGLFRHFSPQPAHQLNDIDRGSKSHMAQMGFA